MNFQWYPGHMTKAKRMMQENEKCELYVLYRSKKNTDGSWYISEAEILDIFAYSMSTKDVVSSGKTSWSATGSEEHEIN